MPPSTNASSSPGMMLPNSPSAPITAAPFPLPNFGGKVLVLNFWASWCPPCVQETPSLSAFAAEYANKGVVVLGISVDKDEKAYRGFLQKFQPAFQTARELHDPRGLRHLHVPGDLHHRLARPRR